MQNLTLTEKQAIVRAVAGEVLDADCTLETYNQYTFPSYLRKLSYWLNQDVKENYFADVVDAMDHLGLAEEGDLEYHFGYKNTDEIRQNLMEHYADELAAAVSRIVGY